MAKNFDPNRYGKKKKKEETRDRMEGLFDEAQQKFSNRVAATQGRKQSEYQQMMDKMDEQALRQSGSWIDQAVAGAGAGGSMGGGIGAVIGGSIGGLAGIANAVDAYSQKGLKPEEALLAGVTGWDPQEERFRAPMGGGGAAISPATTSNAMSLGRNLNSFKSEGASAYSGMPELSTSSDPTRGLRASGATLPALSHADLPPPPGIGGAGRAGTSGIGLGDPVVRKTKKGYGLG